MMSGINVAERATMKDAPRSLGASGGVLPEFLQEPQQRQPLIS